MASVWHVQFEDDFVLFFSSLGVDLLREFDHGLEMRVDLAFPSEAVVPQSVNLGSPALLEHPRSRFAAQVDQLAASISSARSMSNNKRHGCYGRS